ncbi:hypothetical protein AVEN_261676-1 [Araneus ventricosus]|uniref:Uncharacterized protein n=1 Tax=Araneus ventricosus TaxID=182803 RepID=A0A4Y2DX20_ARAVE|nr:hypothetical protein AVEN_261676-1 [Araneus ventricosus]
MTRPPPQSPERHIPLATGRFFSGPCLVPLTPDADQCVPTVLYRQLGDIDSKLKYINFGVNNCCTRVIWLLWKVSKTHPSTFSALAYQRCCSDNCRSNCCNPMFLAGTLGNHTGISMFARSKCWRNPPATMCHCRNLVSKWKQRNIVFVI